MKTCSKCGQPGVYGSSRCAEHNREYQKHWCRLRRKARKPRVEVTRLEQTHSKRARQSVRETRPPGRPYGPDQLRMYNRDVLEPVYAICERRGWRLSPLMMGSFTLSRDEVTKIFTRTSDAVEYAVAHPRKP